MRQQKNIFDPLKTVFWATDNFCIKWIFQKKCHFLPKKFNFLKKWQFIHLFTPLQLFKFSQKMGHFLKIWEKCVQKWRKPTCVCYPNTSWYMVFYHIFAKNAPILVKNCIFLFFINPYFWLFFGVLEVKLKFQDKFYDMIDHNKCPTSEKSAEKCILRNSYFHHSEPSNRRTKMKIWW